MNWKREAENDLRNYIRRKEGLATIHDKLQALKYRRDSVRSSSDRVPVMGGGTSQEDRLLNLICEEERLKLNSLAVEILITGIEKGLEGLTEIERKVLERFYIYPIRGHVERLMEELGYEQRQIYRIKDSALYKFTISQYGLIEY